MPTLGRPQRCAAEHAGDDNNQCETASKWVKARERVCQQMIESRRTRARLNDAKQARRCAPVRTKSRPLEQHDSASHLACYRILILQCVLAAPFRGIISARPLRWSMRPARRWSPAAMPAAWPSAMSRVAVLTEEHQALRLRCCCELLSVERASSSKAPDLTS